MNPLFQTLKTCCLVCLAWMSLLGVVSAASNKTAAEGAIPLVIGHRTIHVFRAPLGTFSAQERAEGARRRIEAAFELPGEGWMSVRPTELGLQLEVDGRPLFRVLPTDASELAGETQTDLADQAAHVLRKVWEESRERRDPKANLHATARACGATVLLVVALWALTRLASRLGTVVVEWLNRWTRHLQGQHVNATMANMVAALAGRLLQLLAWLAGLLTVFLYAAFCLEQYAATRAAGESLAQAFASLGAEAAAAVTGALPGLFVAAAIFLLAWAITRVSAEYFSLVTSRSQAQGWLNAHTAPTTRRIVNALLWLFAVAMSYPYLPGSQTDAFKGLSVLVGLMVSIGASGVVGQIASGIMLVYTYALKKGEYVRILTHEGTVTDMGLFVTRLRTGMGEEIAIPNAVVLGNVTRNFSRVQLADAATCYVLDTTVTIGYDVPWRQVHALLESAARATPDVLGTPAPYVMQTALSDFYVAYKLVVHVGTEAPAARARVASNLHAAIQDAFNRQGVQIMSPHYYGDPQQPKLVPESHWQASSKPL